LCDSRDRKSYVIVFGVLMLSHLLLAVFPFKYPLYTQCNPSWGKDPMGGGATICAEGCAMSCVSMGLAGKNITIDGLTSNPGLCLISFANEMSHF